MNKTYTKLFALCLMMLCSISANAGIRTWDFTKWSEATIANLAAEAATYGKGEQTGVTYPSTTLWRSYEKADGTVEKNGACYWYGTTISENANMKANGVEIEELKGLYFNPFKAGNLAIAIDYAKALSDYDGPSYLWLGGSSNTLTIPGVKPGATITMYVESHNTTDARGVGLTVNGTAVAPIEGTEKPTTKTKCVWKVPYVETTTVDAVFTNNNGCHIYSIEVDENIYAGVQMTWVDYNNPDVAAGEIAAGQTARSGYSKISAGSVENANAGWGENKITYLKVDASAIPGTIAKATLTADVSGSSDNKRETTWGVGYNSSTWSADLTWNTADRTITLIGATQKTTTKSATTFENKSFDITDAFTNDEDKVVTLLVYETAAAGGYIKNPQVTVEYTFGAIVKYTINYVDGEGNALKDATITEAVAGKEVTASNEQMAAFKNAEGSKKYLYVSGNETITLDEDESKNVINLVFREAAIWNYSIVAMDANDAVLKDSIAVGSNFEGETFNMGIPRYINVDGVLYETNKQSSDKKGYYQSITLDKDNKVFTYEYKVATSSSNLVFFSEAEDLDSVALLTAPNAPIRASVGKAAYAPTDIAITKLPAGNYNLKIGFFDASNPAKYEAQFTIGGDTISAAAAGVNLSDVTKQITVAQEDTLKWLKSGNSNMGIDYIIIERNIVAAANIAAAKALPEGTEVALKLDKAVMTLYGGKAMKSYSYIQDSTAAIAIDRNLSNIEIWEENKEVNGTLYVTVGKDNDGNIQLALHEYTGTKSKLTIGEETVVPAAKETTIAEINADPAALHAQLINLKNVKYVKLVISGDYWDEEVYKLVSEGEEKNDTISFWDDYYVFGYDGTPNFEKFISVNGFVEYNWQGDLEFHPYGAYEAIVTPATEVENLAALKEVADGTDVKVTLKNAKVTVYTTGHMGTECYIEDETGAVKLNGGGGGWWSLDPEATDLLTAMGIEGDSVQFDGTLYANLTNSEGTLALSLNDSTQLSTIEKTENVDVTPTTLTISEAKEKVVRYSMCLVAFDNVRFDQEEYDMSIVNGEDTLGVYDMFGTFYDEEMMPFTPDQNTDFQVIGILMDLGEGFGATILPLSYIDMQTVGIKNVTNAEEMLKGKVWNINGMRVNSDAKNLKKGVYIINGKKVVVK